MKLPHHRFLRSFPIPTSHTRPQIRCSSISSNAWIERQRRDTFSRESKLQGLRSRAIFKLQEIQSEFNIFKAGKGQTVVDLGFAPGAWSELAASYADRVIGVDIIPATPPPRVSTFQGDFTSSAVQAAIRKFLQDPSRGRPRARVLLQDEEDVEEDVLADLERGYIDRERMAERDVQAEDENEGDAEKTVHVVLSDMSEPWPKHPVHRRSIDLPYDRMANTSGIGSRDHFMSINLCNSALSFCIDVLKPGGSFVCKLYQGIEAEGLRKRMLIAFSRVHSLKPEASRPESRELYFIGLDMKAKVRKENVFPGGVP